MPFKVIFMEDHIPIKPDRLLNGLNGMWASMKITLIHLPFHWLKKYPIFCQAFMFVKGIRKWGYGCHSSFREKNRKLKNHLPIVMYVSVKQLLDPIVS